MNTIEIPFAIGSEVLVCSSGSHEQWIECPECCGSKAVTLINGNGESATIACGCCANGYNGSLGRVRKSQYQYQPKKFVCRRITGMRDGIAEYSESEPGSTCYGYSPANELFATIDECQAACDKKNAEHLEETKRQVLSSLEHGRRAMAWSVSYWRRQVKDLEEKLAAAKARLAVCKIKKTSPTNERG